ncbi:MAG TPA: Crp/Fnr family transcriptional regulator [Nitrospira sp.]|nr:Crp/Fnr family transcriptional regulator [Nitrospira sp.]
MSQFMVSTHYECEAISSLFRGDLCTSLTSRPGIRIEAGQLVYCQGDMSGSVYFLRTGLIKTSVVMEDGREQILRIYKPGEVFGELCFCTAARREEALALEESEIVKLQFTELIEHLQRNTSALTSFLTTIAHHLSDAYEQIRLLSSEKVMARLIQTLLRLAAEMGAQDGTWVRLRVHLSQDDLARMIGARREVTSTLLNQLRALGCISYAKRGQSHLLVNTAELEHYQHLATSKVTDKLNVG